VFKQVEDSRFDHRLLLLLLLLLLVLGTAPLFVSLPLFLLGHRVLPVQQGRRGRVEALDEGVADHVSVGQFELIILIIKYRKKNKLKRV
jgi:hypothetical protein